MGGDDDDDDDDDGEGRDIVPWRMMRERIEGRERCREKCGGTAEKTGYPCHIDSSRLCL